MGMEFVIKLEEGDLGRPASASPQAPPTAAGSSIVSQSAAPAPGVPIPNLAPIQQTLLPAIAAVAPILARQLSAVAREPELLPRLEAMQPTLEKPAGFLEEAILPAVLELREAIDEDRASREACDRDRGDAAFDEVAALRELRDFLHGDLLPELRDLQLVPETAPAEKPVAEAAAPAPGFAKGIHTNYLSDADIAALEGEVGKERVAAMLQSGAIAREVSRDIGDAAGQVLRETLLPALEDLKLEREEERGLLPPLEEMRLEAELPGALAERQQRALRDKAMRDYTREGVVDVEEIPEALDAKQEAAKDAAQRRLEGVRQQVRAEREYAKLTGGEEPVYDAIDVEKEKKQKELKPYADYLNSGARIAAQVGLGTVGQALGGAADLGIGLATGNVLQAVSGGLELVTAGTKAAAQAMDGLRHGVEFVGHEFADLARNDYMGAFKHAVDFAASSLEKIPIAGDMLGSALRLAAAPVTAFHEVMEAFIGRARELAEFSPELAFATEMAELRSMFADMQEAQDLGPQLAQLVEAQSKLDQKIREAMLPLKQEILDFLNEHMDEFAAIMELGIELLREIAAGVKVSDALASILVPGYDVMKLMLRELGNINRNTQKESDDFDVALRRFYEGLKPGEVPQAWQRDEQQPGIRPPFQPAGGF